MILSQIESTNDSIGFIERNYRKSDPRYANLAIRLQKEVRRRLYEEWERSQCKVTDREKEGGTDIER